MHDVLSDIHGESAAFDAILAGDAYRPWRRRDRPGLRQRVPGIRRAAGLSPAGDGMAFYSVERPVTAGKAEEWKAKYSRTE